MKVFEMHRRIMVYEKLYPKENVELCEQDLAEASKALSNWLHFADGFPSKPFVGQAVESQKDQDMDAKLSSGYGTRLECGVIYTVSRAFTPSVPRIGSRVMDKPRTGDLGKIIMSRGQYTRVDQCRGETGKLLGAHIEERKLTW